MSTKHKRTGTDENIQDRRDKIWALRKAGASYSEIARQVHCSVATVHNDVNAVLNLLRASQLQSAEEYRQIELERLDALQLAHWQRALGRAADKEHPAVPPDIRSARIVLRISDQRSKLLGIYKGTGKIDIIFVMRIIKLIEGRGGDPMSVFKALFETLDTTPFLASGEDEAAPDGYDEYDEIDADATTL